MRYALLILLSAITAAAATAAPAGPSDAESRVAGAAVNLPPAAFTTGAVRPEARALAVLIMPEDLYLNLVERSVIEGFEQQKDDLAELYGEHPGFLDAMRTELSKVTRDYLKRDLPTDYDRYGRALGSNFNATEIAELSAFYRSRIGQKLIVAKFTGMDLGPIIKKLGENEGATLSAEDVRGLNGSVVAKALPHLEQADLDALLAFSKTPTFARMKAFVPVMTALEVQISGEPDPAFDAVIERAIKDVMARFKIGQTNS